jgi:hypothetical protein
MNPLHSLALPPWADGRHTPNVRSVAQWIGVDNHRRWEELVLFILEGYRGQYTPLWRFSRVRRNWELRFQRRRILGGLMPVHHCFWLRIGFTPEEETRVLALLPTLRSHARDDFLAAPEGPKGRVLLLNVDDDDVVQDAKALLAVKRQPKYVCT